MRRSTNHKNRHSSACDALHTGFLVAACQLLLLKTTMQFMWCLSKRASGDVVSTGCRLTSHKCNVGQHCSFGSFWTACCKSSHMWLVLTIVVGRPFDKGTNCVSFRRALPLSCYGSIPIRAARFLGPSSYLRSPVHAMGCGYVHTQSV